MSMTISSLDTMCRQLVVEKTLNSGFPLTNFETDFNQAIEGPIVVTASYYGDGFAGSVKDETTGLPSSLATRPPNCE